MDFVKKIKKGDYYENVNNLSIEELEEIIDYTSDLYHKEGKSVITDAEYDILIDFLKLKSPKSKLLKKIGANIKKDKEKVKLDYHLGSMDKIKIGDKKLDSWIKKYNPPYNISDKLDGVSGLLIYENNDISLYTRGSSTEGFDISHLIKYLNLPSYEDVSKYFKASKIAFRGELIMKDSIFTHNWSDKMKNARNTIAGLVNSKTINPELANDTDFIVYEVIDPFYPIDKQLKIISDLKFKTAPNKNINVELTFEYLSNYLKDRKSKSDYIIDGIIITAISNKKRNTKDNPDYAFAFKDISEDQIAITKVLDIEWNASKDGYLNPILILEPVTIGGVEIKRVTAHNAKYIVDNVLGVGSKIELIRSGDVIPYIKTVLKKSTNGKPKLPDGEWHWNDTEVDIILDNLNDEDVLVKNLYYFFSKLETEGLGEKVLQKMVDANIDSIVKILSASKEDLLKVEGIKDKSADNILKAINDSIHNIPLFKLMVASNKLGRNVGIHRIKQVLEKYPNLLIDYKKWTKKEFIDNLKDIDGWEDKTSTLFVTNFPKFTKFYESISKFITLEKTIVTKKGNKMLNKIIVLTGFRDKELENLIENEGGKVNSTVSKNTDFVVVKDKSILDNPTEKIKNAQKLNIKIYTKDDFILLF